MSERPTTRLDIQVKTTPSLSVAGFTTPSNRETPITIQVVPNLPNTNISTYISNMDLIEFRFFKESSQVGGQWSPVEHPYDIFNFIDTDPDNTNYYDSSRDKQKRHGIEPEDFLRLPTAYFPDGNYRLTAHYFESNSSGDIYYDKSFDFKVSESANVPIINSFSFTPPVSHVNQQITFAIDSDEGIGVFVEPMAGKTINVKWMYRNISNPLATNVKFSSSNASPFNYTFNKKGSYEITLVVTVTGGTVTQPPYYVTHPRRLEISEIPQFSCDFDISPSPPYATSQTIHCIPKYINMTSDQIEGNVQWYDPVTNTTISKTPTSTFDLVFGKQGAYKIGLKASTAIGAQTSEIFKEIKIYPGVEQKTLKVYLDVLPQYRQDFPLTPFQRFKLVASSFYKSTTNCSNVGTVNATPPPPYYPQDMNLGVTYPNLMLNSPFFLIKVDSTKEQGYDITLDAIQLGNLNYIKNSNFWGGSEVVVEHINGDYKTEYTFPVCGAYYESSSSNSFTYLLVCDINNRYSTPFPANRVSADDVMIIDTSMKNPMSNEFQGGVYRHANVTGIAKSTAYYQRPLLYSVEENLDFKYALNSASDYMYSATTYKNFLLESNAAGDLFIHDEVAQYSEAESGDIEHYTQEEFFGWFWYDGHTEENGTIKSQEIKCDITIEAAFMGFSIVEINGYNVLNNSVRFRRHPAMRDGVWTWEAGDSTIDVTLNNNLYLPAGHALSWPDPVASPAALRPVIHTGWNKIYISAGSAIPVSWINNATESNTSFVPFFSIKYKVDGAPAATPATVISGLRTEHDTNTAAWLAIEKSSLGIPAEGNAEETYRNRLYDTIVAGMKDSTLYFAPRQWNEAGKILSASLTYRTGKPVVEIELPKRVSTFFKGVEGYGIYDLPRISDELLTANMPTGCIFATPQKDGAEVIRLSAANPIELYDSSWGASVSKEGLSSHPVILFAQSNNTSSTYKTQSYKLNAFGALMESKSPFIPTNLAFDYVPFKPYMMLLQKDEMLAQADGDYKFFAVTYDAVEKQNKLEYKASHIHFVNPFDINSLKFRNRQDYDTTYYEEISGTLFTKEAVALVPTPPAGHTRWGVSDVVNKSGTITGASATYTKDRQSWSLIPSLNFSSLTLTYQQAGTLFLKAIDTPTLKGDNWQYNNTFTAYIASANETTSYTTFNGQPYNWGVGGDTSGYCTKAMFKSFNNVFSNYGMNPPNTSNYYSINDFQLWGEAGSALVGVNQSLDIGSQKIITKMYDSIKSISNNNRNIVFTWDNNIYIYDQLYAVEQGPYNLFTESNSFGLYSASITNINSTGKILLRYIRPENTPQNIITYKCRPEDMESLGLTKNEASYNNQISLPVGKNNIICDLPLASKYFGGSTIEINTDYLNSKNNWQVVAASLGNYYSSPNEQNVSDTRSVDLGIRTNIQISNYPDREFAMSIYENSAYYTTDAACGLATIGQHTYYYQTDINTGNVTENFEGNYKISVEDLSSSLSDNTFMLQLNPDNTRQHISIQGEYDEYPFTVSSDIVLSDFVKPQINGGADKVLVKTTDTSNKINIRFTAQDWYPDDILVCPTQLEDNSDYETFFDTIAKENTELKSREQYGSYEISFDYDILNIGDSSDLSATPKTYTIRNSAGNHTVTLGLRQFPAGKQYTRTCSKNYLQNGKQELWSNFSANLMLVDENDISIPQPTVLPNQQGTKIITVNPIIKNCLAIKLISGTNTFYNANDNTTTIKCDIALPTSKAISFPVSVKTSVTNRLKGCTLAIMRDKFEMDRRIVSSNDDKQIIVEGNLIQDGFANSSGVIAYIAPFIPYQVKIYSAEGYEDKSQFFTYPATFKTSDAAGTTDIQKGVWMNMQFNPCVYSVSYQYFYVELTDNPSSFSYVSRQYVGIVSSSSGGTLADQQTVYGDLAIFTDYDETFQLFRTPFGLGAGSNRNDFFNLGKYNENNESSLPDDPDLYFRIKFSAPVKCTETVMNIYGYDETLESYFTIFGSPFTYVTGETLLGASRLIAIGGNITEINGVKYSDAFVAKVDRVSLTGATGTPFSGWKSIEIYIVSKDVLGQEVKYGTNPTTQ